MKKQTQDTIEALIGAYGYSRQEAIEACKNYNELITADKTPYICASTIVKEDDTYNPAWLNNLTQFTRLLAEMETVGVFTDDVLELISSETDMEASDICSLLSRAQWLWDNIYKPGV